MSIFGDLKEAWVRWRELRDPAPQYTRFTHPLPRFDLPEPTILSRALPRVAIVTPCKNAGAHLAAYFALIDGLDYPKKRLHLILLEGDSTDDTYDQARRLLEDRIDDYAGTLLTKLDLGFTLDGQNRTRAHLQRARRSAIAACRNALLRAAFETDADYVLFVDADMAVIPDHALKLALSYQAPIMMANCLKFGDDTVFDKNAFRYTRRVSDRLAEAYVQDDIYQPPSGFFRHYPDPNSHETVEQIDSVGGTFLLIRRDVIEAGVSFPETPYQLHLETEGFALEASAKGFGSFMLPGLIVRHGPN